MRVTHERQPDTLLDRELHEDVCRLQVDHAGFVDDDPIARTQHVLGWSAVYGASAEIDFSHSKPGPHLCAGLVGAPSVAMVRKQGMNTGCRCPDLARRHRCRFPCGSNNKHPPLLRRERRERSAQHRRLTRAGGAGHRDEPVRAGDGARGNALRRIQCRQILVRCKLVQLPRQQGAPRSGEHVQAASETHLGAYSLGRHERLHVRRRIVRNEPVDGARGTLSDVGDHAVEPIALRNDARSRERAYCSRADVEDAEPPAAGCGPFVCVDNCLCSE